MASPRTKKKLPSKQLKDVPMLIRFTEEQKQRISDAAEKSGLARETWARLTLLTEAARVLNKHPEGV